MASCPENPLGFIAFRRGSLAPEIEAARAADAPALAALASLLPDAGIPAPGRDLLLVARQEAGLAGFLDGAWVAGELHVHAIVVSPEARRSGVGRALLARALDEARRRGAHEAQLEVGADNHAARALYDAAGFREVGRRPAYYDGNHDAILLSLALAAPDAAPAK